MPEPTDAMITTPFYQQQQYEVSKFLKIKPLVLGILEILIALLGLGLTIWNESFFVIWSPIIFIIIGAITVSAAHTRTPRLVKTSQMLSYANFAVVVFSLRAHFIYIRVTPDVSFYVLFICDILIFIFSLAVAVTSCSCCCGPKSTPVMVSYVTTDMPVNHIMQMGQPDPSAEAQPISSVMYVLPAAHGSVPPATLPNYGHVPNASPPMYSPVPTTPPSNYDKVSDALPPKYCPVPTASPPAYEHEDFQTRR
ncbi:uncharacterized protein [Sinocyclocheilus grahami]|uniref:uncharacterized protein n=1 Tax=Sinocyclocheilus grahami TaxID=75366 RepID=UPI0007AC74B1|nr:PREDICTED: uncharacterized protein LOC107588339 [Sinocyclocheilus grahami]